MRLFDAHNHLAIDAPALTAQSAPVCCVTNSTREEEWDILAESAQTQQRIIPAFGIHPWFAESASPQWQEDLLKHLKSVPSIIGEIGLDRARCPDTTEQQEKIFREQLALAHRENVPVAIHCVKALGALVQILTEQPLPEAGFLMHSYGGSIEVARRLIPLGAYFTVSTKSLLKGGDGTRDLCAAIPLERLLVESDLPISQETLSAEQPALAENYQRISTLRNIDMKELAKQIEKNFKTLFGKFIRLS